MNSWVWVLTFTVLGSSPEHGVISKFTTREECNQALVQLKEEKKKHNKNLIGSCNLTLKDANSK